MNTLLRFEGDDVAEVGGVEGRFMVGFIDRLLRGNLRTKDDGAFAVTVIDMVEHALKALVLIAVFGINQIPGTDADIYKYFSRKMFPIRKIHFRKMFPERKKNTIYTIGKTNSQGFQTRLILAPEFYIHPNAYSGIYCILPSFSIGNLQKTMDSPIGLPCLCKAVSKDAWRL